MINFIIMTSITLAFGALLFYAIFKSVDDVTQKPPDKIIEKLFKYDNYEIVFPEILTKQIFVKEEVLEKFKNTDGFYALSKYYGHSLVRYVYKVKNSENVVANVFLYCNNIVVYFVSDSKLM